MKTTAELILTSELSDDALLEMLKHATKQSNRVVWGTLSGMASSSLAGISLMLLTRQPLFCVILPAGMGVTLFAASAWGRNHLQRLESVIAELRHRRNPRAVPLLFLLELNHVQMKPTMRRPTTETITSLMPYFTSETFQQLSTEQIRQLVTRVYSPDGPLRHAILEAVQRCGDARALRCLQSPLFRPVGEITDQTRAEVAACLHALQARIEEEQRLASLVRPAYDRAMSDANLLRAAAPTESASQEATLLRASPVPAELEAVVPLQSPLLFPNSPVPAKAPTARNAEAHAEQTLTQGNR